MEQHEKDAIEAVAINAINRRLAAVNRTNWGIVDVSAKHVIVHALEQVVNDKVAPAYAEMSQVTAPEQNVVEALEESLRVFNRERAET